MKRRMITAACLPLLLVLSLSICLGAPADEQAPKKEETETKVITYKAGEIKTIISKGQGLTLSNGVVTDSLEIDDNSKKVLKFQNMTFEKELKIGGIYDQIAFDHCQFKSNVDFYVVFSRFLRISNCQFLGSASFNMDLSGFALRESDFSKAVNLTGTTLTKANGITITRLTTREPIRISWSQFGETWLRELSSRESVRLGGEFEEESNRRQVLAELEFWRDNFTKLGHRRDAAEVNYEIIEFARKNQISLEPYRSDWWASYLLSWPSRYGTRPYRPLWISLVVICIFAIIFWIKDPFVGKDQKQPPQKARNPKVIFALMYSLDTFLPVVNVTNVKEWGWEISPSFRWITVVERMLGLLVVYAAAFSLSFYVL